MPCVFVAIVLSLISWTTASEEGKDEVRLCSVGLGHFGKLAAKIAVTNKNVKLVAAFTRNSFIGQDIGDVLELGRKYGVTVSSIDDMGEVLQETQPNICFDATQTLLSEVYENYVTLLKHGVNILSLAEQHVFPYDVSNGDYYGKIHQLALENGVTVFGTGFQDLYLQQFALSLSSAMLRIDRVDVTWSGDFNTGVLAYAPYVGLGLSASDFDEQGVSDPDRNVFSHLMKEWSLAMAKWYAKSLGLGVPKEDATVLLIQPVVNEADGEGVYAKAIGEYVGKGHNLGINITCSLVTLDNVDILFRNELRVYNEGMHHQDIEIALYGDPEVRKVVIPAADVENGTIVTAVNRIPQIIRAPAGYYNVDQMDVGLAKYWKGVPVDEPNKVEL